MGVLVLLAGCGSGDGLPAPQQGLTAGRAWVQVPIEQREAPLEVAGRTVEGQVVDIAHMHGSVVVLNTWYAGCAPCRAEAPVLQGVAERYAGTAGTAEAVEVQPGAEPDEQAGGRPGVQVVGVNVRQDSAARVRAFQERYELSYPSIDDADGSVLLGLRGVVPAATPTTLVLDTWGRVAASVAGEVDASTLEGLVEDVLTEDVLAEDVPTGSTAGAVVSPPAAVPSPGAGG
ncbi:TlpA family protein disulfide reductase [Kineococcus sp. SYSU DK005]|uniref:TlpA family protein disulfide reductase n=1 Tax=Kineococcus sp. SYSU DK005 TaxID=3383126 RepID=UPI003D7DF3D4